MGKVQDEDGAGNGEIGERLRRAQVDAAEARYQSATLNRLRGEALKRAQQLERALEALNAAERTSPRRRSHEDVIRLDHESPSKSIRDVGVEFSAPPRIGVLNQLPRLIAHLNAPIARTSSKRGRPKKPARLAQEALAPDALTNERMAALLRREGLESGTVDENGNRPQDRVKWRRDRIRRQRK